MYLLILLAIGLLYTLVTYRLHRRYPETIWDWDKQNLNDLEFPENFMWGTATASHQVEGGNVNNWSRWEEGNHRDGTPHIHNNDQSGQACEHYARYKEDIARIKELGLSSYRFSLAWNRIEPTPGDYNEEAIAHYHQVIDTCKQMGIRPMVTLHHFTHPLWFEDIGSFEHEENIEHFLRFSEKVFSEYGRKVKYWCTHNEPGPFATMGWGLGMFPPGIRSLKRMSRVLQNLMRSHLRVYKKLKSMPGGDKAQIGLVKNIFQFDPYRRWSLLHWALCRLLDHVYNESIIRFLRDGLFRIYVPGVVFIQEKFEDAKGATDFIGLNYYSNLIMSPLSPQKPPFKPLTRPGQVLTDFPYTTYAEGFYRALKRINTIGRPIMVTENGIPDAKDDRREIFIRRYIYALSLAIKDGCDVRAYYYWSLLDNFEWAEGYSMRFGLYAMNFETQERTLREGAKAYQEIVQQHGLKPHAR